MEARVGIGRLRGCFQLQNACFLAGIKITRAHSGPAQDNSFADVFADSLSMPVTIAFADAECADQVCAGCWKTHFYSFATITLFPGASTRRLVWGVSRRIC